MTIEQGETESLTIEADDNVLPVLTSEVNDSVLELGTKPRTTVRTRNPIRYRVTLKDLTSIELSGSGSVSGADLQVNALRVDISGSGTMNLAGAADQQEVEVSGSGRYGAAELLSRSVTIEISGSGNATVAASDQLRVEISGSGTVTYSGDPRSTSRSAAPGAWSSSSGPSSLSRQPHPDRPALQPPRPGRSSSMARSGRSSH